jgi:hypothetical protein
MNRTELNQKVQNWVRLQLSCILAKIGYQEYSVPNLKSDNLKTKNIEIEIKKG